MLQEWNKDPEFNALPIEEKGKILSNFFHSEMADDEFRALPEDQQKEIHNNFLRSEGYEQPQPTMVQKGIELAGQGADYLKGLIPETSPVADGTDPAFNELGIKQEQPADDVSIDLTGLPKLDVSPVTDPFVKQGKIAAGAFNRGMATFSDGLDSIATWISEKTGFEKGGVFEAATKEYSKNAEYWDSKVKNAGLVDEIVGEFIGGAAPGMAEFMLGPGYAAMVGGAKEGPKGAVKEGMKRAILGKILHSTSGLNVAPRTVGMAAVGATEAAAAGGDLREIAKSAGVMAGFGMTGGKGGKSVKEAGKQFKESFKKTKPIGKLITQSKWFKKLNVKMRGKTLNTVAKMHKAGMSDAEIARKLMKEQKMSGLEIEKELEAMKGIKRKAPEAGVRPKITEKPIKAKKTKEPIVKITPKKERVTIPKLKSSEEAVAFGQKATPIEVKALRVLRERTIKEANKISVADAAKDKALDKKRTDLTQKAALYTEAIQFAGGRKLPKDIAERLEKAQKVAVVEKPVKSVKPKKQPTTLPKPKKPKVEAPVKAEKVKEPWEMSNKEYLKKESDKELIDSLIYDDFETMGRVALKKKHGLTDKQYDKYKEDFLLDEVGDIDNIDPTAVHKLFIKKALSEGKPVPKSVLKDYPDLQKKVKPEKIEITGKKAKTVKVDMPKKEADALTPKEQKKYLISEIDAAIKGAKEGPRDIIKKITKDTMSFEKSEIADHNAKAYQNNIDKYGTVTIRVPGDGDFTLINNKSSLTQFKKIARKFPLNALPPKTRTVSQKPLAKRITGEGIEYYNPFRPRKQKLIEIKKTRGNIWKEPYYSDRGYIIKLSGKPKFKYKVTKEGPNIKTYIKEALADKEYGRAEIKGEAYVGHEKDSKTIADVVVRDKHIPIQTKYPDHILAEYPKAKVYAKDDKSAVLFKDNGKVVGIVMPVTDAGAIDLVAGHKRLYGKKKAPAKKQKEYASAEIKTEPKKAIPSPKYTPIPKGKRHSAILKSIEKKLKVPIRIGGYRKKVGKVTRAGIYKPGAHIIRLAKANDIPVAVHEIGHAVEKLLGLPKKMPAEVQDMAYPGAKNLDREGFAEFLRFYVTEPAKAKRRAPNFHKDFENALKSQPELQDVLITVKQAWKEFQSAPSVSKVGSFVVRGGKQGRRMSINRLYTEVKDNLWPLVEAVNFAKTKGKAFKPSEDPYKMARLMRGWPRKAEQYLTTGTFQYDAKTGIKETGRSLKSILKPIERAGDMELLDIYLVAKRATTDVRVRKGFERVLSQADFNQTVMELEPKFGKVGKQLQKYNDELLKFLLDSGRISKDAYKAIKAKNPFYAPLYRLFDSDASPKNVGQKAGGIFNPIKRLKGSSRDIYSPTESLLYNTYVMINSAERTRVGNAIRELAKVEGMGQFIDRVPFRQKPTKVNKDDFLKLLHQYGEFKQVRTVRQSERTINNELKEFAKSPTSKVEGRVTEALTARGWTPAEAKQILNRIKGTEEGSRGDVVEKIVEKTTIMTIKEELGFSGMPDQVIATFRPDIKAGKNEVILYNKGKPELYEVTDRDLYEAVANIDAGDMHLFIKALAYPAKWLRAGATTFSPEFAIRNPLRDQMTAWIQTKYGYVPGIDFLRGVFHMAGKTEVWKKFNAGGGAHAVITSMDRNYLHKDLKSIFKEKSLLRLARNPLEVLQRISEYTEEATRVGEAAKAFKKEGGDYESMLKGAFAGREVSLDFMRQGRTAARSLNMISAFWNARIEGLDKMARSFKDQPKKTAMKAFLGITLPSVLLWYAQKDDPYYNELPSWRRTMFWNFVFHNEDGSLKFILPIPKPFEYGLIFGSIPEAALDWMYTKSPDLFKETMETVGESANILPMPTAAVPVIEWYGNRSMFFERPLVPRGKEDLDPYLQYKGTTSETVKVVTKLMNEVPVLKMIASPAKIENMIMGYTAAMGRLALDAGDWLIEELGVVEIPPDTEMKLSDLPGIRAFRVRFPSGNTRSIEQFYTKYINAKRKWESDKERKGVRGKGIKINKAMGVAMGMSPELVKFEMSAKVLTLLRKSANMIYKNKTMTPKEKTERLNGIYLNMINVARAALQKKKIKL